MDDPSDQGAPVELSEEETAVMLGCYADTPIAELSKTTGLPPARVETIVQRLAQLGLIDAPAAEAPSEAGDDLVALLDSAMFDLLPPAEGDWEPAPPVGEEQPRPSTTTRARPVEDRPGEDRPTEAAEAPVVELGGVDEPAEAGETAETTREYKKLFEAEIHPLSVDERVALAATVTGARLFAMCFDPEAVVIAAMFENTGTTVEHARLIAFHHRGRGLDEIASRAPLVADALVHRRLVRNPALSEATMRRLLGTKRLGDVFRVTLDRDVPERTRVAARGLLRTKFAAAAAEERVEIVWTTEGRVLLAVPGLTFDGRTTSMLCSKAYVSVMLVTNLARFNATPPALLAHLLRQQMVKRQPHLRNMLLQHPNTPKDAKRRI